MRFNQSTDFALRTLLYLAANNTKNIKIKEICQAYNISHNHLAKVVQKLNHLDYITIKQGRYGGIRLKQDTRDIKIGNVIQQMENDFFLLECFNPKTYDKCIISPVCKYKSIINKAFLNFIESLNNYTLLDIINDDNKDKYNLLFQQNNEV